MAFLTYAFGWKFSLFWVNTQFKISLLLLLISFLEVVWVLRRLMLFCRQGKVLVQVLFSDLTGLCRGVTCSSLSWASAFVPAVSAIVFPSQLPCPVPRPFWFYLVLSFCMLARFSLLGACYSIHAFFFTFWFQSSFKALSALGLSIYFSLLK